MRLEVWVRRIVWVMLLFSGWGCTEGSVRSATLPESADFLPTISGNDSSRSEEPRLLIRCEGGRIGAYVVVEGTSETETDSGPVEAVPVSLDSTLAC
jgi:hypothetical protein